MISNQFTTTKLINGVRELYKCYHYETNRCRYWEWRDKKNLPDMPMFIQNKKHSLNVLHQEWNLLRKMIDFLPPNTSKEFP